MDAEVTALEEKLSKARQVKQGMMQELLGRAFCQPILIKHWQLPDLSQVLNLIFCMFTII